MYTEREIYLDDSKDYMDVKAFLKDLNLKMPENLDYTIGIYHKDTLIGTGSLGKNIIKGVGISPEYQGEGIASLIITHLIKKAIENEIYNIFIYTNPNSQSMFLELGFNKIAEALPYAVLLEWGGHIDDYLFDLKEISRDKPSNASCIVINGNPFTLGHRYLIEKAAAESPFLYVLVVEEDKSIFPFDIRFELIKKGLKDIKNLEIIAGGDYIISAATFPSYFSKKVDLAMAHSLLDLDLFSKHIAPSLKISKRYVGEEPYCEVTSIYNQTMKKLLPERGIEVIEIPRLEMEGSWVSASRVRDAMRTGDIESIKNIVPLSTYNFLVSSHGKDIIRKIQRTEKRRGDGCEN